MSDPSVLEHAHLSDEDDGPEPRVLTRDVRDILFRAVKPDDEEAGASVALIAEKAATSTRTVYRVLALNTETLSLSLGDRLCVAVGAHLSECRLKWSDGSVTPYF